MNLMAEPDILQLVYSPVNKIRWSIKAVLRSKLIRVDDLLSRSGKHCQQKAVMKITSVKRAIKDWGVRHQPSYIECKNCLNTVVNKWVLRRRLKLVMLWKGETGCGMVFLIDGATTGKARSVMNVQTWIMYNNGRSDERDVQITRSRLWSRLCSYLECYDSQFVHNSLFHWQPMKLTQKRWCTRTPRSMQYNSGEIILKSS